MFIQFMRTNKWAAGLLLLIRFYVGYAWISAGIGKVSNGFDASGFLQGAIAKATGDHPAVQSWWAWFLEQVALPNANLFTFMVEWGEVLVGVGLILGGLTKTAAFFGIVMNMAFLLSGTVSTNPILLILSMFILIAGSNAGRLGLDYYVFRKLNFKRRPADKLHAEHRTAPIA